MGENVNNFPKKLDMLNSIGLKATIDDLMMKESKFIPVADVCKEYTGKLNNGYREEELLESFISALAKVATNETSKHAVAKLSAIYESHKRDIDNVKALCEISKSNYSYVVPMIESSIVNYMIDKNATTREVARQSLYLFEGVPSLKTIAENLSFDEYEEKTNRRLINSRLNEAKLPQPKKTYTQEELDVIVENAKASALNEAAASKKEEVSYKSIDTHIDLSGAISKILEKESRNEGLKAFCEQYIAAKNSGKSDESLYESFISGISNWNYLNAVDTELSALNDRISKYKQEIDLKKILEVMSQTQSYYIVPLIEGVVVDYMNNKSMNNKAILKQRLEAFEYDPFVRDILNIVQRDFSIANTVYLGESVELVNSKVHTEKIYSPVLYIKENECVFNVKGTYYDRKGNTITKLTKSAVAALDESFKTLCNVLNHPAVVFDEATDSIKIYDDKDIASVNESDIVINGDSVTTQELENLASMSKLMNEHKEGFYAAVNMINENYNKIAYIDFVKRVALNESNARTVDVFRIKDNIFVNTTDNILGKSVFYRNINPMQCRTYINEHMEINAAPLFEDILPNQESIQKDIDDTKKQYEDYISDLENKKSDLEKMKDTVDDDTLKDVEAAIKLIDDELKDIKDNYKSYQKESDEFVGTDSEDDSEEPSEEPAETSADETPETEDDKPAEEVPSDAEVSTPIEDTVPEEPVATPYDDLLDAPATDDGYEIVKVSYQQNVKTGKKTGKGEVYLMIPSVDANGDVHNELKTVTFYLDNDRTPILNNEYMPLAMYNAIKDAVLQAPDTQSVELTPQEDENPSVEDLPAPVEPVSTEVPDEEPVEDMFGLDDDPETMDDIASLTDEIPAADDSFDEGGFDSSFGPESSDSSIDSSVFSDEGEDDIVDLPVSDETPVKDVKQETPAETENKKVGPSYPITLGLSYDDISPIKSERFVESMERLGIEHSTPEGFGKSGCCLSIKDKADAYALRDYFKEWKNFDDNQFNKFFPELAECFGGPASAATNESVKILAVQGVNNSVVLNESKQGIITLKIPASAKYLNAFELSNDKKIDESVKSIVIKTTGFDESAAVYRKAKALYEAYNGKVTSTVKDFLKKYESDFGRATVHTLITDYSNLLESKISNAGIVTKVKDDKLLISITEAEKPKLKKIFEGYYKESMPKKISDFFQKSEGSLKEGIKITIKDDKTGKTIELDTDDLDKTSSSDDGQAPADAVSNEFTTFTPEDSQLFGGNDSSDDSDDEDKDKKKDSEDDKKNESDDVEEKNSETKEEKSKKKLKFKVKKKVKKSSDEEEKTDESVKPKSDVKTLNESAEPNILDWVICNNGIKCQIIAKMPNGEFILNDRGKTIQCPSSYFKLAVPKTDEVPVPFKYDKNTLKGLYEQMVRAGMFMNNTQITPNDCYVKYSDYKDAKDDDDIRLVIEGQATYAAKKYIRVLEDVNEFANPADYIDGVEVASDGHTLRQLKINKKDYETGVGSSAPVRVLVDCDSEDCKAVQLPKGSLLIKGMD